MNQRPLGYEPSEQFGNLSFFLVLASFLSIKAFFEKLFQKERLISRLLYPAIGLLIFSVLNVYGLKY